MRAYYIALLVCLGIYFPMTVGAQELKLQVAKSVYLNQKSMKPLYYTPIQFKNLNKEPYYKNKKLAREIELTENREFKDYPLLDSLLTQYVANFGIKNFSQVSDLELVWKLGEVKEIRKDTTGALFFYGLALKNQSRYFNKVKVHYDKLREARQNEYVDLDYYYKIVAARLKIDTLRPPKGVLLNMGVTVNSTAPDYAPYMHPSNSVLIFTSRRSDYEAVIGYDYNQNEDLYFTEVDYLNGGWNYAKPFPTEINSRYNEGSACLNKDGNLLYFTRCNAPDGLGVCDIYAADYDLYDIDKDRQWINIRNLGPLVNSSAWDSQPALSPDEKTLYFSSNRGEGFGRTDIWKTTMQEDGSWGKAENLGPVINTIEDEMTPFFHPINNTLYFSSTGHIHNNGGYDIFKSRFLDEAFWENPRNLGPLVNTERDEYYFSIDIKGDTLFYANASAEDPRNFDLYSFAMPMGARPDAVYALSGFLIDTASGKPITGIVVAFDMDANINIEPVYINPNGFFEFRLINKRRYTLMVLGENNIRIGEMSVPSRDSSAALFGQSISLKKPLIYDALQFQTDSVRITPKIANKLDYLIDYLIKHPECKLKISGHTDSDGDSTYNLQLSQSRAEKIKDYICKQTGMAPDNINAVGYGETRPIYPNDSPRNKSRNRRVEFDLIIDGTKRNTQEEEHRREPENKPLEIDHHEFEDEKDDKKNKKDQNTNNNNPTENMNLNSIDAELDEDYEEGEEDLDAFDDEDDFDDEDLDDFDDEDFDDDDVADAADEDDLEDDAMDEDWEDDFEEEEDDDF